MPESAGSVINIGAGKHTKRQLGQFCYADDCTHPLPAYKQVVSIFLFLGGVQWGTRVLPALVQNAPSLQPWRLLQFSYGCQKLFCLFGLTCLLAAHSPPDKAQRKGDVQLWGVSRHCVTRCAVRQVLLLQVWAESSPKSRVTSIFSR